MTCPNCLKLIEFAELVRDCPPSALHLMPLAAQATLDQTPQLDQSVKRGNKGKPHTPCTEEEEDLKKWLVKNPNYRCSYCKHYERKNIGGPRNFGSCTKFNEPKYALATDFPCWEVKENLAEFYPGKPHTPEEETCPACLGTEEVLIENESGGSGKAPFAKYGPCPNCKPKKTMAITGVCASCGAGLREGVCPQCEPPQKQPCRLCEDTGYFPPKSLSWPHRVKCPNGCKPKKE